MNDIYTTTAIFIAEIPYIPLILAILKPRKEKISNTFVSAMLNFNGADE